MIMVEWKGIELTIAMLGFEVVERHGYGQGKADRERDKETRCEAEK